MEFESTSQVAFGEIGHRYCKELLGEIPKLRYPGWHGIGIIETVSLNQISDHFYNSAEPMDHISTSIDGFYQSFPICTMATRVIFPLLPLKSQQHHELTSEPFEDWLEHQSLKDILHNIVV